MEHEALNFGTKDGLHGQLTWRGGYGTQGPVGKTWGDLSMSIGRTLIWGRRDEFGAVESMTWCWVDLLEFLACAWHYLLHDEMGPPPFDEDETAAPITLGTLHARAIQRWNTLPDGQIDDEDNRLRDFLVVHDLGESLAGACPPALILLRHGELMHVSSENETWALPFVDTMVALGELGERIAERIEDLTDSRSTQVRTRWGSREPLPDTGRLANVIGNRCVPLDVVVATPMAQTQPTQTQPTQKCMRAQSASRQDGVPRARAKWMERAKRQARKRSCQCSPSLPSQTSGK